jgi:aspartokinase/homoserine dehydrogenase 1
MKFGGTSLADPARIRAVAEIVSTEAVRGPVVVVVSAMGGVTNALADAARTAAAGSEAWRDGWEALTRRHQQVLGELLGGEPDEPLEAEFRQLLDQDLRDLLHGVSLVREASPRTLDAILAHGELLSARLVALALRRRGTPALSLDARGLLVSDDRFGNARVLWNESATAIRGHLSPLSTPAAPARPARGPILPIPVPVVTGFVAATTRGETTTLGRGGSDYTASVLGAALGADAIEIWTDVDGVMSADPRIVPDANHVSAMTYAELMELSHFGARVVYPPTVHSARDAGIPLVIRNTFNPDFPGTRVGDDVQINGHTPVRGIASIHKVALLRVEGDGMVGVPGSAQRLFGALARRGINVILISQASSERSICIAVEPGDLAEARKAVSEEFALEYRVGLLDELVVEEDCSILAAVGGGMRSCPGIAGQVFSVLGRAGINVRAIAQGSSELNLSLVVASADEATALRAIHGAFFSPGVRSARIFLAGAGTVGHAFLRQMADAGERLRRERGFHLTLAGIARRARAVVRPDGIDPARWQEAFPGTEGGAGAPAWGEGSLHTLVEAALAAPRPAVFVDLTADDAPTLHYGRLLREGVSVVAANKRGVSGPGEAWRLLRAAPARGAGLYIETTVGAALPVLRTLADLVATGDRVERIEGVLSGTLSYLACRAMDGGPFSALVREAHGLGITEPDPRDDLSGMDVVRKLVILARFAGMELEAGDVAVDPFLPVERWAGLDVEGLWRRLPEEDPAMDVRVRGARERGMRLVYLAQVSAEGARVGLREVGPEHPCYGLRPGDNLFAIHSGHYHATPLVVQGPGAGPGLTAAGVFADVLRAVAEAG